MARPTKPGVQVNGKAVDGLWKSARGFYLFDSFKQASDKRESCATPEPAIARSNRWGGIKLAIPSGTIQPARDAAEFHRIDPRYSDRNPE